MTGQQLKNSILQLAIQGKLVPQNPEDEPASALLERIRTEKEKLTKEGKISKNKNPSVIFRGTDGLFYEKKGNSKPVCIQDEIPFEIPDNWCWCRFKAISNITSAKRVHQSDWRSEGVPFYRAREIGKLAETGHVDNELFISEKQYLEYSAYGIPHPGDLMVTAVGTLGKTYIVKEGDRFYYKDASVICIENYGHINPYFLKIILNSPYMSFQIKDNSSGTTVGTITIGKAGDYLVPMAPLDEQVRIVNKLSEIIPLVQDYDNAEKRLSDYNKSFPEQLKKSLLQYAMQGKLVPQNPEDEPASVLLERIREEKKKLVKDGVIKKGNHESVIYKRDNSYYEKIDAKERCIDDEIPFDIPDSWMWARLGYISSYANTKQKVKITDVSPSVWELDLEDIEKGGKVLAKKVVRERPFAGDKTVFRKGDILYSKLRPYLLKILVAVDDGVCSSEIVPFQVYGDIASRYIVEYLKSPYIDNLINSITYGVKMPRVGTDTMTSLLVPVPPLSEQFRIVAKIDEVIPYLSFGTKALQNESSGEFE